MTDFAHQGTPLDGDGEVPPLPLGAGADLSGLSEEERKVLTEGLTEAFAKATKEVEVPLSTSTDVARAGPSGGILERAREVWDDLVGRHVTQAEKEERLARALAVVEMRRQLANTEIGTIVVTMDGGSKRTWRLYGDDLEWWEMAKEHWPLNEAGEMHIPRDKVKIITETPRFATCTFSATKDFLSAMWGRTLDRSDEDWIKRHPHGQEGGMPQEYVLTALQELVEPYNLAISRVRILAGAFFIGDALNQWVEALGCNPFALADHSTTNAEAAERLGISLAEADRMWRFEFGREPLRPSVLGERGFAKDEKHTQSSWGGHARFLAPRAGHGDWWYSIQFAPIERVEAYASPITFPEYVPREDVDVLMLQDVRGPDNLDIADRTYAATDPRKWREAFARRRGGATGGHYPIHGPPRTSGMGRGPNGGNDSTRPGRITVYHGDGTVRDGTGMLLVGVEHDIPYGRLMDAIHKKVGKEAKRYHYADLWQHVSHIFRTPSDTPPSYYCVWCKKSHDNHTSRLDMKFVCEDAYRAVWEKYACPTKQCQIQFDTRHAPVCLGRDRGKGRVIFACPGLRCGTEFAVYPSDADEMLVRLAILVSSTYVNKVRPSHH